MSGVNRLLPAAIATLLTFGSVAFAQSTASITGVIRDASGATVEGATVTASNTNTGFRRSAPSFGSGTYTLENLPIGPYEITAVLTGFKTTKVPNVVLQVAQEARVDIELRPGDVTATVDVTSAPSLIQTDSAALGQVIDNKKIVDLPLNGRNFIQLAALTPGALTSASAGGPNGGEVTGAATVSVSGTQSAKTEILLDGITNSDQLFDGVIFSPSVDFIQEFRVQANSFGAEYGRGSAIVNVSTRSGTNAIHGTAFEFFRNDYMDAKNFFARTTPPLRRNQFGGSLGGPVLKNKLFFFVNYEGQRQRQPLTNVATVPTAAQRAGDFSGSAPLKDPFTGSPIPGNRITNIDPISQYFLQFVPLPNSGTNFYNFNATAANDADQGNVRVDYVLNERNAFFARYSQSNIRGSSPGGLPTSGGITQITNPKNAAVSFTHSFTPTLLNEARVGYTRLYSNLSPQGLGTNYTTQAGILGFDQTSANFPGFPTVSVSGYSAFTNGTAFDPIVNPTNTFEYTDIVRWNKGRHSISAGIDVRHYHLTSTNAAWSRGSFSYSNRFTGNALADYLLGYPSSGIRDYPRNQFGLKQLDLPLFVQDDIKVSSRLTVNLGLRYDLMDAPTQDLGQNSIFDVGLGKWVVSTYRDGQINLTTQQVAQYAYDNFKQYIVTAQQAGLPNNIQTISKKNFAPRVGAAFRPFDNDRTVVRVGYGIFYDLQRGNNSVTNGIVNLPFILDQFFFPGGSTPQFTTKNLFAAPFQSAGLDLSSTDLRIRPPYSQEWNFTVQQSLAPSLALQVAYVGNKGTRLDRDVAFNYPVPGPGGVGPRRAFSQFGNGDLRTNAGNSNYNALQVTLEKRFSAGLTFLTNYTWSKSIDDTNTSSDACGCQDPARLYLERAVSNQDIPHRSVTSFSYELPVGRNRTFGKGIPRALDLAIGGWQVAGILTFQSGSPFNPTQENDSANTQSGFGFRPDVVPNTNLYPANQSINNWFNVGAFAAVPNNSYRYGNAGRNILRGPRYNNEDFSLLKHFNFTESKYLEVRGEAFNVLNHPNFFNPNSDIQSSSAGVITGAFPARELQVAMKFYF